METALFYMVLIFLSGGLMILGLTKRIGLFNILTLPIWLYLAIEWSEEPLLVITMVGLMFLNIWLAWREKF